VRRGQCQLLLLLRLKARLPLELPMELTREAGLLALPKTHRKMG
jgi:hypothetical protein